MGVENSAVLFAKMGLGQAEQQISLVVHIARGIRSWEALTKILLHVGDHGPGKQPLGGKHVEDGQCCAIHGAWLANLRENKLRVAAVAAAAVIPTLLSDLLLALGENGREVSHISDLFPLFLFAGTLWPSCSSLSSCWGVCLLWTLTCWRSSSGRR